MAKIETLQQVRWRHVREVLEHANGDVLEASRMLDVSPVTLRKMLREMGWAKEPRGSDENRLPKGGQ